MDKGHFAVSNKADVGISRDELNTLLQRIFQFGQLLAWKRSVNQKQENRLLDCSLLRQNVLNRGVVCHELGGQLRLRDVLRIVGGEAIFVQANGAVPSLVSEVNFRVRVHHGFAGVARHGGVLNKRQVLNILHGGVHAANRDNNSGGTKLVAGPKVPTEANTVSCFSRVKFHLSEHSLF